VRNDALSIEEIRALKPSHIMLSPGPGYPKDAGVCEDVIRTMNGEVPILGVCLGHQAICEVYGANITHARQLMHGKKSRIKLDTGSPLFAGLPKQIDAARYHSLVAQEGTLPDELNVIANDGIGEIMAVSHKVYHIYGVQFHPESVLTPQGDVILRNFLSLEGGQK
jgi:anthranilate synthase/aminodeoxychorismate synthase-like glutamine amidotransferase